MKITLATDFIARYPEGGGLWSWFLDYPLGLKALGHEVCWIDILRTRQTQPEIDRLKHSFFERTKRFGLDEQCALLVTDNRSNQVVLEQAGCHGKSREQLRQLAAETDILWNLAGALQGPMLGLFNRRVFVDGDPGHLHVSALDCDFSLDAHHVFLTAGLHLGDAACEVPRLGKQWHPFPPFVHLPLWPVAPGPDVSAPITSVTQWNWGEIWWNQRPLSISKREAYLRYVELPQRSARPFELAANIGLDDPTGDRELLQRHGWRLVHPHAVASTPEAYQAYIAGSRAEICCPKPVYRELRTGWLSERSAHYLAAGRPVLAEDTGFGDAIPTGEGFLAFRDMDEALEGVRAIDGDYAKHSRAARALAEEYMDAKKCLPAMLAVCG